MLEACKEMSQRFVTPFIPASSWLFIATCRGFLQYSSLEFSILLIIVWKVKVAQSCPTLCNPMDYTVHGILQARILEWVAIPFSRGIFPTQGMNPGLLHCRQILYQLSHEGSPRIQEWVGYPFSRGSSQPRSWTRVSSIAGGFLTNWVIREAHHKYNDT